jgi:hypothetical protein
LFTKNGTAQYPVNGILMEYFEDETLKYSIKSNLTDYSAVRRKFFIWLMGWGKTYPTRQIWSFFLNSLSSDYIFK